MDCILNGEVFNLLETCLFGSLKSVHYTEVFVWCRHIKKLVGIRGSSLKYSGTSE